MLSSFLICAGPRTGSTLLAAALRKTGIAGRPREYFSSALMYEPYELNLIGASLDTAPMLEWGDRLHGILGAGTTPNNVFGTTVHWGGQLDNLLTAVAERNGRDVPRKGRAPEWLHEFFPALRFVWLRRDDRLAQAVSHYTARRTGRWYVSSDAPASDPRANRDIPFDFNAIGKLVHWAGQEHAGWRRFLEGCEHITLTLTYEELATDYASTLARVLAFIGVPLPASAIPPPSLRRQADERSQELMRRYKEEEARRPNKSILGTFCCLLTSCAQCLVDAI